MIKSIIAFSCVIAVVLAQGGGARQYVDCSCSQSARGYGNGARDQVRDDIAKVREYEAQLVEAAKTDPTLTRAKINNMVQERAIQKWNGCVNNLSYEECANADAAWRRPAGKISDSFCRYNARTWTNGKPGCDKNPATASQEQTITEGTPEIVSATPPPGTVQAPAQLPPVQPVRPPSPRPSPAAQPAPQRPAPQSPAPQRPAPQSPAAVAPPANGKVPPPAAPSPPTNTKPSVTAVPPGRPNVPVAQTPPPGTAPANQPAQAPADDMPANDPNAEPSTIDGDEFPAVSEGTPGPEIRNEAVCFPSSATVQLQDGSVKKMSNVELGDKVLVAAGKYSEVYMFTHKLENVRHNFVTLKASNGIEISLTSGHYVYVNGALVPAGTAKVGDTLQSPSGDSHAIESVTWKVMNGLYNPQTVHGDIVVDGVRASTYTTVAQPTAAHAMLAPLRSLYNRFGGFTTTMLDSGCDVLAKGVSAIVA